MNHLSCYLVSALLFATVSFGQTALTGGMNGLVTDEKSHRPVGGASITLRQGRLTRAATATPAGEFFFTGIPAGKGYVLVVDASGFERFTLEVAVDSGDTAQIAAVLKLGKVQETIVVTESLTALAAVPQEVSQTIDARRLNELPQNGRNQNRFALLNAHVRNVQGLGSDGLSSNRISINGASWRDTRYKIDGNTNYDSFINSSPTQNVSISAVAEFKVVTNQFSAEHGNTAAGVVISTTKSGTDDFHGEALFFGRPSGIQARPPLSTLRVPNQLLQYGASLGGPIRKGQTYFFANYEKSRQNRGAFIQSPLPSLFVGKGTNDLALARLDHALSGSHRLSLRLNGNRNTNTNAADVVSGFNQPSTARNDINQALGAQVNETYARSNFVNELRLSYTNSVPWNQTPIVSGPVVSRPNYSVEGANAFIFIRQMSYQAAEQMALQKGRHALRIGGEYIKRNMNELSWNTDGTYTFAAGPPRANEVPVTFAQTTGIARITFGQVYYAAFVQDDWRPTSKLNLNFGRRYDAQSNTQDKNNIAPRFGFAYDLGGDGSTVLRGGAGIFYDEPFMHTLNQRYLKNGIIAPQYSYTLRPGDAAYPGFPNSLPPRLGLQPDLAFTPRNLFFPASKILNPYTSQFNLNLQRKLAGGWTLALGGIRSLTVKQFQNFNYNAPSPFPRTAAGQVRTQAAADATRPLTVYQGVPIRNLLIGANSGMANYHALDVGVSRRFAKRYQLESQWVWSSAITNSSDDHNGANPNEWSNIGSAERGPSLYFQRHRWVSNGLVQLPWATQLSGVFTLGSGVPVNAITGVDNNGDTTVRDRPVGFSKNSFRGPRLTTVDLSLAKTVRLSESARLELRAESYNLLNGSNYHNLNGTYGNGATALATFLQPIAGVANTDPGRQFTFGARIIF